MSRKIGFFLAYSAALCLLAQSQDLREFPLSRFKTLPAPIRQDLIRRGCTIPQPPYSGSTKMWNVIHGNFRAPNGNDVGVLCDVVSKNTSMILIYWDQSPSNPTVLSKAPIWQSGCWSTIEPVGKAYVLEHYRAYGGPKPPPIDHQGINVGICEKASTVSYLYKGRWLTLTGAD